MTLYESVVHKSKSTFYANFGGDFFIAYAFVLGPLNLGSAVPWNLDNY